MVNIVQRGKDVIEEVNRVFVKRGSREFLKNHIQDALYREGVVKSRKVAQPKLLQPMIGNDMVCCKLKPTENIFRQSVEIIVKPDHDTHDRKMHLYVSIGDTIEERDVNKDNHKSSTKKVVKKEEREVNTDLREILRHHKKRLKVKHI